jgi:hypothetical protein
MGMLVCWYPPDYLVFFMVFIVLSNRTSAKHQNKQNNYTLTMAMSMDKIDCLSPTSKYMIWRLINVIRWCSSVNSIYACNWIICFKIWNYNSQLRVALLESWETKFVIVLAKFWWLKCSETNYNYCFYFEYYTYCISGENLSRAEKRSSSSSLQSCKCSYVEQLSKAAFLSLRSSSSSMQSLSSSYIEKRDPPPPYR